MKNIFVINGSASSNSSNQKLIDIFVNLTREFFNISVFKELKLLPHFDPELSIEMTPKAILDFRQEIETADGILICTPEYVFSIPSGLKNAIEWCVSTTLFSEKPVGLITASAQGEKGHLELQLIMETLMANFTADTTLLISGIKGKIDENGKITDDKTKAALSNFVNAFERIVS
ncbi:NADPH-dependent FMN reductase [Chryseobacterium sp. OSA05B]|uniref:NADPH-dependent FMN reductase n=1 Tax=Chryseobacterium sp. OSA05B TaxID=2862650 RepID=UPI001CC18EEC|nr:NADPH-dependent FMN reductase [Chryseobacterium sp. OSA05B]